MLSIGPISSVNYYTHIEDDYWSRGKSESYWLGRGATRLGLSGAVTSETLARLLNGFSP